MKKSSTGSRSAEQRFRTLIAVAHGHGKTIK